MLTLSAGLLAGCTSYSFRGTQVKAPDSLPTDMPCKFRLTSYSFSSQAANVAGPWAIAGSSVDRMNTHVLETVLQRLKPELFSSDPSGLPFQVSVEIREGDASYIGLIPYFLSLGILPGRIVCFHEKGYVRVCLDTAKNRLERKVDLGFSSKGWLSVWTPLAAMACDKPGEYAGENRHGTGIMKAPHLYQSCRTDEVDVFSITVADAVIAALGQMDPDTLKRSAVLQALTEEH